MYLRCVRWPLFWMLIGAACLLAGCRANHRPISTLLHQASSALRATITIPHDQMLFRPFLLAIQPGTRVSWQNEDSVAHTIVTTATNTAVLNPQALRLSVAAGKTVSYALTRPGLYDYFDPTQANWNSTDQRVSARQEVPHYPMAMEGMLWVQGPLSGLSSPVTIIIPGRDLFSQYAIALPQGGTAIWQNADQDEHRIAFVPGWQAPINPVNPGTLILKGRQTQPDGGRGRLTFTTPGLYYYYCPLHASIQSTWKRAQAFKDASEAPIPMEGFILVTAHT